MENFLLYIGKSALAAGAFYLVYLALFQNQKQFAFNRIYLPVSLAVSFLIPLITFTTVNYVEPVPVEFNPLPVFTEPMESPVVIQSSPQFTWEWYHYLFAIYAAGTLLFLFRLLLGHGKAWNIIRKSRVQQLFNSLVNISKKDIHPFSFFSKIVLSENTLSHPHLEMIVEHEKIHVKEKHTLDILFTEILFLLQWFNPFAWLLKDAVKNNLEYKTDHEIAKTTDAQTYQLAMLALADKQGVAPFLTALNGSQLKSRIIMMKKKSRNKFGRLKQLVVLPLLAVLVMGLAEREVRTEFINPNKKVEIFLNGEEISNNHEDLKGINFSEPIDAKQIIKALNLKDVKATRLEDSASNSKLYIRTGDYIPENMRLEVFINGEKIPSTNPDLEKIDLSKPINRAEIIDALKIEDVVVTSLHNGIGNYSFYVVTKDYEPGQNKEFEKAIPALKSIINTKNSHDEIDDVQIQGKIINEKGEPIEGAIVKSNETKLEIFTKEDGTFILPVSKTPTTITVLKEGYDKHQITLDSVFNFRAQLTQNGFPGTFNIKKRSKGNTQKENENLNLFDFSQLKIVIDGKEIPTNSPELKDIQITPENLHNSKYVTEIVDALNIDLDDIKRSKASNNSNNPYVYIQTKNYVPGTNKEFEEKMELDDFIMEKINRQNDSLTIKDLNSLGNNRPLIAINGVPQFRVSQSFDITSADKKDISKLTDIPLQDIQSIEVLKDDASTKVYGPQGSEGIVNIKTKKDVNTIQGKVNIENNKNRLADEVNGVQLRNYNDPSKRPLYIIDGTEKENMDELHPEDILSINVLKDKATEKYGEKGKNGVVLVTTKNQRDIAPAKNMRNDQVIGNITWINNEKYSSSELTNALGIREGDKYSRELIEAQLYSDVSDLYLDNGYLFFNATLTEKRRNDKTVDLEFTLLEGTRWKVGKIEVTGNKSVSIQEALNKILISTGDVFSRSKLIQSVENLNEIINQDTELVDVEVNPESTNFDGEFKTVNLVFNIKNSNEKITTALDLRKFIAKGIKFPNEARDMGNDELHMRFFAYINNNGRITKVSEKPTGDSEIVHIEEIVIVASRDTTKMRDYDIDDGNALADEAVRVIKELPEIDIPKLHGKIAELNFKFVLQE